jgi:hypothetical protein
MWDVSIECGTLQNTGWLAVGWWYSRGQRWLVKWCFSLAGSSRLVAVHMWLHGAREIQYDGGYQGNREMLRASCSGLLWMSVLLTVKTCAMKRNHTGHEISYQSQQHRAECVPMRADWAAARL